LQFVLAMLCKNSMGMSEKKEREGTTTDTRQTSSITKNL